MTITDRTQTQFFGIKEYRTPKCIVDCSKRPSNKLAQFDKAKIVSYFTEQAEKMKKLPSPADYCKINEWNKIKIQGGILNKTKKVSCTAEIMERAKESPGVGKYKWNKAFRIHGGSRHRSRRTTFIDETNAHSKEIPGPKYKLNIKRVLK